MEMPENRFAAALRGERRQIGLWMSLASNVAAEVVAGAGYDWVLIDMEHAPNDVNSVLAQLQVFANSGTTALVRPGWNDPVLVKRLLDIGAQGLLFPMVQSVAEAQAAIAAARYPPRGIRGVSGSTRANAYGRMRDYFTRVEDETPVLVQIETRAALERANRIAAVDGVSGVFFGPADIAADIGFLGRPMEPAVWDLIRPCAQALIAAGVPVGTLVADPDFAAGLLDEGFSFVACGSDANLLAHGADRLLTRLRRDGRTARASDHQDK